jgi:hypothetical protein
MLSPLSPPRRRHYARRQPPCRQRHAQRLHIFSAAISSITAAYFMTFYYQPLRRADVFRCHRCFACYAADNMIAFSP